MQRSSSPGSVLGTATATATGYTLKAEPTQLQNNEVNYTHHRMLFCAKLSKLVSLLICISDCVYSFYTVSGVGSILLVFVLILVAGVLAVVVVVVRLLSSTCVVVTVLCVSS